MTIISRPSTGGLGFDTNQKISASQAASLRASGYTWCARYLPLPDNDPRDDIDLAELAILLDAGFEVLLVQHVRYSGWNPRMHSGSLDASVAAAHAITAHYPIGAHIFCDWEGVVPGIDPHGGIMFLESWSSRIISAGFSPGLYVGYQQPLSALQLYDLRGFDQYWSDAGHRVVDVRGCSIEQDREETISGVKIDVDTMAPDRLGAVPMVAVNATEVV